MRGPGPNRGAAVAQKTDQGVDTQGGAPGRLLSSESTTRREDHRLRTAAGLADYSGLDLLVTFPSREKNKKSLQTSSYTLPLSFQTPADMPSKMMASGIKPGHFLMQF